MKNKFIQYISLVSLALTLCFTNSCIEEIPSLSRSSKILADSLFHVEEQILKSEVDSLCNLIYDKRFNAAVDSVKKLRLAEIEKILKLK